MANNIEIIFGKKSSRHQNKLFVNEMDFDFPHGEDYKLAIQKLENIQISKIDGVAFLSLFEYDDISLWWFIYQSLIPLYKKLVNFIEKFLNLIDTEKPKTVRIVDNFNKFTLIEQICKQQKINFEYSHISKQRNIGKNKFEQLIEKSRYDKITKNKINTRKKLFTEISDTIPSMQNKILFAIPTSYRREIFDHKKGISTKGEHLIQPIFNLIDSNDFIGLDLDYTFKGDFDILSERLSDNTLNWLPIEALLSFQSESNSFLSKYSNLLKNQKFQDLFTFKGISLWPSLNFFFHSMSYAPYLPFYIKLIHSLQDHFQKNTPKAIFLPYETGPLSLVLISVSKKFKIKTIGIQHGYIYNDSPMYSFTTFWNKQNPFGFLIPDTMLLFGDETKKLLMKKNYPEQNLFVFGNPNFFNIEQIEKIFSNNELKIKYEINNEKNIILFTTGKLQPYYSSHGEYDYDVKILTHLLENFSNNKKYTIVLKPHPQEKNVDIYKTLIQKYGATNFMIIQGNVLELIYISSIVISVFSSTMLDSLCFKKPVIRVKFDDENPIFDQTDAVLKTNLADLSLNITDILENNEQKNILLNNGKDFVLSQYGIPEENISLKINNILRSEKYDE